LMVVQNGDFDLFRHACFPLSGLAVSAQDTGKRIK
jgi:hypothetical protein